MVKSGDKIIKIYMYIYWIAIFPKSHWPDNPFKVDRECEARGRNNPKNISKPKIISSVKSSDDDDDDGDDEDDDDGGHKR